MTRAWTIIVVSLLAAGCSQVTAYQPPNPCAPGVPASEAWTSNLPTPHLVALGTWQGHKVVCE